MLIGRKEELRELNDAFKSEYSEFVAVYGRRRVGKTFLVREAFNYEFTFQHTGVDERAWPEDVLVRVKKGKDGKVSNTPVHCLVVCLKSELMEALMQRRTIRPRRGP